MSDQYAFEGSATELIFHEVIHSEDIDSSELGKTKTTELDVLCVAAKSILCFLSSLQLIQISFCMIKSKYTTITLTV